MNNHAMYQLATKALIYKEDKILTLKNPGGKIDFPGGRVDESERDLPWEEALLREVKEEIGENAQISVGKTLFVSKRQYEKDGEMNFIAAIFFECQFESGDIQLSDEHISYEWLSLEDLANIEEEYVSSDEERHIQALVK